MSEEGSNGGEEEARKGELEEERKERTKEERKKERQRREGSEEVLRASPLLLCPVMSLLFLVPVLHQC